MLCQHHEISPGLWVCPTCNHPAVTSHAPRRECGPHHPRKPQAISAVREPAVTASVARQVCVHRGEKLRDEGCKTCQSGTGQPFVEVFSCDVHGECTKHNTSITPPRPKACATCPDYSPLVQLESTPAKPDPVPFTGPVIRNLLMYIYPKQTKSYVLPEWRRNIEQVLRRIDLFTGKRVFAVATDAQSATVDHVREVMAGTPCEIVEFPNIPELGESVALRTLLAAVRSEEPNEITYYCHAKGVSKQGTTEIEQIRKWVDTMHEVCLDRIDEVELALTDHIFTGAFRVPSASFPSGHKSRNEWHYSGTFFWFRNQPIFSNPNWIRTGEHYWGAEAWPGNQCEITSAACLFQELPSGIQLYKPDYWETTGNAALVNWRANQVGRQSATISIVTTCKGRLEHLQQTLPAMMAQAVSEVIVVDYGCPDGAAAWCESLNQPRLKFVRVTRDTDQFSCSRSRNIGIRESSCHYLLVLDADVTPPPGYAERMVQTMTTEGWQLCCVATNGHLNGQFAVTRDAWERVHGLDEGMLGWGHEDGDFYQRVDRAGISWGSLEDCGLSLIVHSDELSTRFQTEKDKHVAAKSIPMVLAYARSPSKYYCVLLPFYCFRCSPKVVSDLGAHR